ncbi:diguanylate cyclase [Azospirillaceae bacterium]
MEIGFIMSDLERVQELARLAMDRLTAEGLGPTPENFTLWFTYYSGEMPDLTRAVDVTFRDKSPFTQARADELFKNFFSMDAETKLLRETSDRTQSALTKVLDMLQAVAGDTGRYGEALDGFSGQLRQGLSREQLRSMLTDILRETKNISAEQERLQNHLIDTTHQLTELRAHLHVAQREALTDGLTGISNRKAFDAALHDAVVDAQVQNTSLCLVMVDIDFFKKFNDSHGHLIGDLVLKLVARVLTECIKGRDTAARYGGEEFSIILPRTVLENAGMLANQIRISVGSRQIINRTRNESFGAITLSMGVAQYRIGEEIPDFIKRADMALYMAKHTGRNRVCLETELPNGG